MTNPMAFQGVLTAVKHIKTRDTVQFVVEVDGAAAANAALTAIGGFPSAGESRWVAVAAIKAPHQVTGAQNRDGSQVGDEQAGDVTANYGDQP